MKDKDMKFVLGAVLVAVSATAAIATPTMIGGCEVERIKGSNAYFRTDASCVFGKALTSSGIRYSTKAAPVSSVSPTIEIDRPSVWARLGNLLTNDGMGNGNAAVDRSGPDLNHDGQVVGAGYSNPGPATPSEGGDNLADGKANNTPSGPDTESTGPAVKSDAAGEVDGNNGHGNDEGGLDASNPGQGGDAGASADAGSQNGEGGGAGALNSDDQGGGQAASAGDGNNGHGNDEGGVDPSNPGNGEGAGPSGGDGTSNGQGNGGGSSNGANNQGGGQSADADAGGDGNNGHGNDAGGVDPSNPGKGRPKS